LWIGVNAWQAPEPEAGSATQVSEAAAAETVEQVTPEEAAAEGLVLAVEPKPLSEAVRKGLEWLRNNQHENGGWSQGEEASGMRSSTRKAGKGLSSAQQTSTTTHDPANVADTCVAALALLRSGSTPSSGDYSTEILGGVDYVCASVEASDDKSLYVTDVRGTRVQSKIGTYVDTFLTSMLLTEVRDDMPDDEGAQRVGACLRKVLDKIEMNQAKNGGFDSQGWAPVLSQGLASKALNRASMLGFKVKEEVLASNDGVYAGPGDTLPSGSGSTAGVMLYGSSAKLGAQQDAVNNGYRRERDLREELEGTEDEKKVALIENELDRIATGRKTQRATQEAVIGRLGNKEFVAGFGNNGGEEFLSYMNISESLVVRGDDTWREWDEEISANVSRVQNKDGSWTGHHCITGRTFCTSTALLTLMADRVEVPAELLANR
jgi:hypothetical protein